VYPPPADARILAATQALHQQNKLLPLLKEAGAL
jgi:hypothetical protein